MKGGIGENQFQLFLYLCFRLIGEHFPVVFRHRVFQNDLTDGVCLDFARCRVLHRGNATLLQGDSPSAQPAVCRRCILQIVSSNT